MIRLRVEAFNERYRPDLGAAGPFTSWTRRDTARLLGSEPALYTSFTQSQARSSYEEGLIRFLGSTTVPSIEDWNDAEGWGADWPAWAGRLVCFAYDWMGRLYALDTARLLDGEALVSRLDPGTGKVLESDDTFAEFVLSDLVQYGSDLMDARRFRDWRSASGCRLIDTEVAGYVRPLFDDGPDDLSNFEVVELGPYVARTGRAFLTNYQSRPPEMAEAKRRRFT